MLRYASTEYSAANRAVKELPDGVRPYHRTPDFDAASIPSGLLREHRTKPGTWGLIVVQRGQLLYRILEPELEEVLLGPDRCGVVEPQVPHEVKPVGDVSFHVAFYR